MYSCPRALPRSTGRWGLLPALHFQVPFKILAKETEADDSVYEICVIPMLQMLKGKGRLVVTCKEMDIKITDDF